MSSGELSTPEVRMLKMSVEKIHGKAHNSFQRLGLQWGGHVLI